MSVKLSVVKQSARQIGRLRLKDLVTKGYTRTQVELALAREGLSTDIFVTPNTYAKMMGYSPSEVEKILESNQRETIQSKLGNTLILLGRADTSVLFGFGQAEIGDEEVETRLVINEVEMS